MLIAGHHCEPVHSDSQHIEVRGPSGIIHILTWTQHGQIEKLS